MSKHLMPDAVQTEIFRHLLDSIAEEMGVTLQYSSYSPNIKERRDFSCALFDIQGTMGAQASHIPVHLRAMPLSVESCMRTVNLLAGVVFLVFV
ncbi:MAG: hydantoinase B/oxoprolinase family protein, partial [Anaerolineales bacterium]|nr:hydantoinase B/oxoprolinase family protein [Anaerolineales bacterium]